MVDTKLEISMAKLEKDVEQILKSLDSNTAEHREIKLMVKEFVETAERRYAPMWTAVAIKMVLGLVITAVIVEAMRIIINK